VEVDVQLPLDAPVPAAAPVPADAPPPEPTLAEHEVATPPPSRRHRARSQQASADDVPRIAELTKRLRETEAERDRWKNGSSAPVERATSVPRPEMPAPRRADEPARLVPPMTIPVAAFADDPEPDPSEYLDNPAKNYVKDQARWEARQEIREANDRAQQAAQERTREAETTRLQQHWRTREQTVKSKYADFEKVAYAPTAIPQGSMIDNFIIESAAGLDVLYHLQKHRPELDAMLALPIFDPDTNRYPQLEALSLLAQRLSPSRAQAVSTGSAAPLPMTRPRPPNPVRTGPMSAGDEIPGDDASIADHERHWNQKRRP